MPSKFICIKLLLTSPNVCRALKQRLGVGVSWLWWRAADMFATSIAVQLLVPTNTNAVPCSAQINRPFYSLHLTVTKITKVLLAIFFFLNIFSRDISEVLVLFRGDVREMRPVFRTLRPRCHTQRPYTRMDPLVGCFIPSSCLLFWAC